MYETIHWCSKQYIRNKAIYENYTINEQTLQV